VNFTHHDKVGCARCGADLGSHGDLRSKSERMAANAIATDPSSHISSISRRDE
jgi:hypothetical protein